jgi:putative DNA primase/helicase
VSEPQFILDKKKQRASRRGSATPSANGSEKPPSGHASKEVIPPSLVVEMLSEIDVKPVEWLIPNWLPLGKLTLLAGDGKCGKTTLLLHIAAALSNGLKVLGHHQRDEHCEVLLLCAEDDAADTLKPRLIALDAECSRIHALRGYSSSDGKLHHFSVGMSDLLSDYLSQHANIRLVIIDPIAAYLGRADDNSDAEVRQALQGLVDIASSRNVAVAILKHTGKSDRKAFHKTLGSVAWRNLSRMVWFIGRDPENEDQIVLCHESNLTERMDSLCYSLDRPGSDRLNAIRLSQELRHLTEEKRGELLAQLFEINWHGISKKRADDLTGSGGGGRDAPKLNAACAWLQDRLADGPKKLVDLRKDWEVAKFATQTMYKARERLAVREFEPNGKPPKYWQLPADDTRTDGQTDTRTKGQTDKTV